MALDTVGANEDGGRIVVMLPGYGDRVGEFRKRGFLDPAIEDPERFAEELWVATDAHFGYYRTKTLPERFEEDILARWPDREVALVGISLGGLGVSLLARFYPERVEEVVLIAPFFGREPLIRERVVTGDLEPRPDDKPVVRELLANWRWLIENPHDHRITLMYGDRDRAARLGPLVSELAPHVHQIKGPGRHKWVDWVPLWERYLEERETRAD